jgi:phosphatidylglycerophosphate synthase
MLNNEHSGYLLSRTERRLKSYLVPRVPKYINTQLLTYTTLLWCVIAVFCGWAATRNLAYLLLLNLVILAQHVTDMLDGAIGRARNTGLVKWGFYMDHLLDYLFMSSVVIAYIVILPRSYLLAGLMFQIIFAGFMIHSFLMTVATGKFTIHIKGFGTSEARYLLVMFNLIAVFAGLKFLQRAFVVLIPVLIIFFCLVVFDTQKKLKKLDLASK